MSASFTADEILYATSSHLKSGRGMALEKSARGLIVDRRSRYASAAKDFTIISVPDTGIALLDMVRYLASLHKVESGGRHR